MELRLGCRVAAAGCLVLALAMPSHAASFRQLYRGAKDAIDNQRWQDAARLLREAIEEEPKARASIRGGEPYLPYFYLGLVLDEVGDCVGAVEVWAESDRQSVVRQFPQYRTLMSKRVACQQRQDALSQVRQTLAAVTAARSKIASRWKNAAYSEIWDDTLLNSWDDATWLLGRAGEIAAKDRALPQLDAMQLVQQRLLEAAEALEKIGRELDARDRRRSAVVRTTLDEVRRQAVRHLQRTEVLRPFPNILDQRREELRRVLAHVDELGAEHAPATVQQLADELAGALQRSTLAASFPPDWLEAAFVAYGEGRYEDALADLTGHDPETDRSRAHLYLLRAASSYALEQHGSVDSDYFESARRDILALHEMESELAPSRRYFSPRFIEFFANAGVTPGELTEPGEPGAAAASKP